MPTASTFTRSVYLSDIPDPAKSVGAHLAAKLQIFQTDERTLTDELCDMLCIWLGMGGASSQGAGPILPPFTLTLSKTTTAEEVKNGADLELIVSSPLGSKRCLIQAKVLDPSSGKLRCDSKAGWKKLRTQLALARSEVGDDLAFLLVYVPRTLLDGNIYGYGTYEQHYENYTTTGKRPAYFGATLIPVSALLGSKNGWRNTKSKVPQLTTGEFKYGVALWRILVELLLCRRSKWTQDTTVRSDDQTKAFRRLSISASEINKKGWLQLQAAADEFLPHEPGNERGGNGV